MNKFIVRIIWESPLGALIYRIWDYIDTRREKKAFRAYLASKPLAVQVINRNLLGEAIKRIKQAIKASYDIKDLSSGRIRHMNMTDFAKGNNEKLAQTLEKIYVYHDKDIKTQTDKELMVYKRIDHYRDLQKDVLKRNLIRAIRKETDPAKKAELEAEFNKKYVAK